MIQRIQSLLLAGVVILLTINLFVPIWSVDTEAKNHNYIILTALEINYVDGISNTKIPVYYIAGTILISIGLALYIIFQYKKRSLQILLCSLLTLMHLCILGSYFLAIPKAKALMHVTMDGDYGIGYFLPIISMLLVIGARYFIKKDDDLVKSVDRIR